MDEPDGTGNTQRSAPAPSNSGTGGFHSHVFLFAHQLFFIAPGYEGAHSISFGVAILFALDDHELDIELENDRRVRCRTAVCRSDAVAAVRSPGAFAAIQTYPATRAGIGLSRYLAGRDMAPDPLPAPDPKPFLSATGTTDSARHGELLDASEQLAEEVLQLVGRPVEIDERVLRVRDMLLDNPPKRLRLDHLARAVNLSGDRLTHLFSDEAGIPLRSFTLWCKANRAMQLFVRHPDADWASIAHDAGFSDLSHGIRTLRQYFGVSPGWVRSAAAPRFVHVHGGRY